MRAALSLLVGLTALRRAPFAAAEMSTMFGYALDSVTYIAYGQVRGIVFAGDNLFLFQTLNDTACSPL